MVLHALCALALLGSSIHQAIVALGTIGSRGRSRPRLSRIYGWVCLLCYLGTMLFGSLVYPRYRYFVRALYLDRHAPWAANLFDLKENLATIGLPLCIGAFLLSRRPAEEPEIRVLYGCFALGTALICLFNVVAGLLCTSVHGV